MSFKTSSTRKAKQNARRSRRQKANPWANQHESGRDGIKVAQEAYGVENIGVSESSYEPARAPTSLKQDDDCAATDLKPLGNSEQ